MLLTSRTVNLRLLPTQWLQLCSEIILGHEDGSGAAGQDSYEAPDCVRPLLAVSFLNLLYCRSPKSKIIDCTLVTDGVNLGGGGAVLKLSIFSIL